MSRLPRQCGILNISQPYWPPRPVTGIAFYFFTSKKKTEVRGLSTRAKYTDRLTATCRRSKCQLLRIEGATWSVWKIPTAVLTFSRPEQLLFLSSTSSIVLTRMSGSRSRPTTSEKLWYDWNRTRTSGSVGRNSDGQSVPFHSANCVKLLQWHAEQCSLALLKASCGSWEWDSNWWTVRNDVSYAVRAEVI
jgi:hypothetical protein